MYNWNSQDYMGFGDNYFQPQPKVRKTTKRDILDFIQVNTQASEIVLVEDFENVLTRHICNGGNSIQVLKQYTYSLQIESGVINIQYFLCNICRKCIVDANSIEPMN